MKRLVGVRKQRYLVAAIVCVAGAATFGSIALAGTTGARVSIKAGDVWDSHSNVGFDVGSFASVDLAQVTVPAGSYLITAKVSLKNTSASGNFECRIRDVSGNRDDGQVTTAGAFKGEVMPLQALAVYATTTTVYLTCSADQGSASWYRLDALRVGKVH